MATLTLHSFLTPTRITVPYRAEMPLWQYLSEIIVNAHPSVALDKDGISVSRVLVRYFFETPSKDFRHEVAFDYANRLTLLGDVIPPYGKLHLIFGYHDIADKLRGNASPLDNTRPECPICLADDTNCRLLCGHSFHFDCISSLPAGKRKCPMCQRSLHAFDLSMLKTRADREAIVISD